MPRDILFVLISDPNVPVELERLLEVEGFRLVPGPEGLGVCRSDRTGGTGPQVALIVTQPPGQEPASAFRALYARVHRVDLDGSDVRDDQEAVERLLRRVLPPDAA